MTAAGFDRALLLFTRRRPVIPFMLEFITGEHIVVHHPEAVVIRTHVVIFRDRKGLHRVFDASSVCQLLDPPARAE